MPVFSSFSRGSRGESGRGRKGEFFTDRKENSLYDKQSDGMRDSPPDRSGQALHTCPLSALNGSKSSSVLGFSYNQILKSVPFVPGLKIISDQPASRKAWRPSAASIRSDMKRSWKRSMIDFQTLRVHFYTVLVATRRRSIINSQSFFVVSIHDLRLE